MTDRISGQVAQILTVNELVLNKGENDGVRVGMRFAVLNRQGTHIKDPETGEDLGSLDIEKTVVKIVRVQDRVSVGRTFRTYKKGGGMLGLSVGMFAPASTEVENLKLASAPLKEELDETASYVKIGDPMVQIIGEEFSTE